MAIILNDQHRVVYSKEDPERPQDDGPLWGADFLACRGVWSLEAQCDNPQCRHSTVNCLAAGMDCHARARNGGVYWVPTQFSPSLEAQLDNPQCRQPAVNHLK